MSSGSARSYKPNRPDIELFISVEPDHGFVRLSYELTTQHLAESVIRRKFGDISIHPREMESTITLIKERMDSLRHSPKGSGQILSECDKLGFKLFRSLFPKELRRQLWDLADKEHTLWLVSQDIWIPWELCKICFEDDQGNSFTGDFLAEAFLLTKGLWEDEVKPRTQRLTMEHAALIYHPEAHNLDEKDFLFALWNEGAHVTSSKGLEQSLAQGCHDIYHFTGHARGDDLDESFAVIPLEYDDQFNPFHLEGAARNLREKAPLIFLNGCSTGRLGKSLSEIAGWPKEFLAAGAAAFIGTSWKVSDHAGVTFVHAFYASLLSGDMISEAVRIARQAVKKVEPLSFAAYTVFAYPTARVHRTRPLSTAAKKLISTYQNGFRRNPHPIHPPMESIVQYDQTGRWIIHAKIEGQLIFRGLPKDIHPGMTLEGDWAPGAYPISIEAVGYPTIDMVCDIVAGQTEELYITEALILERLPKPNKVYQMIDDDFFVEILGGILAPGDLKNRNGELLHIPSFQMSRHPVTQRQWLMYADSKPWLSCFTPPNMRPVPDYPDLPAVGMSWMEVEQWIRELNLRSSDTTYRLPTECQWEYACREGHKTFDKEREKRKLPKRAWYQINSRIHNGRTLKLVATKEPNCLGLYDMQGNIQEWCRDWEDIRWHPTQNEDLSRQRRDGKKVIRGGSILETGDQCLSVRRWGYSCQRGNLNIGFRLIKEVVNI